MIWEAKEKIIATVYRKTGMNELLQIKISQFSQITKIPKGSFSYSTNIVSETKALFYCCTKIFHTSFRFVVLHIQI